MVDIQIVTDQIRAGFADYRDAFSGITAGASHRFLKRDWHGIQRAAAERTALYKQSVSAVCEKVDGNPDPATWRVIRQRFEEQIEGERDAELLSTFYNSVFRRLNDRRNLNEDHAFVSVSPPGIHEGDAELSVLYSDETLEGLVRQALMGSDLSRNFLDLERDVVLCANRIGSKLAFPGRFYEMELIRPVFYRNKGAYLIGRIRLPDSWVPIAFSVGPGPGDLLVDAIVWGEDRLSVLFSFTRSYFMVACPDPEHVVAYLARLLPAKKRSELLTAIGFFKHGKTEFVRGYENHLANSTDKFVIAEGIKGQVMMVFGLASYQVVFKVIKDRFPATKSVDRDDVLNAYQLVKAHDRVGRMADTQEFHEFVFPKDRFEDDVLQELIKVAKDSVTISGDVVEIKHLYAERMMTPLNLYIQRCSTEELAAVLEDYGNAIKDLAAANIFPGDMLLKNFGVTRHGRVVFYDYDEICYLTEIRFRTIPDRSDGQTLAAGPWFNVDEYDVFPEEFETFLFPDEKMQAMFRAHHADLFTAKGWQFFQEQVEAAYISDVMPYPLSERLEG